MGCYTKTQASSLLEAAVNSSWLLARSQQSNWESEVAESSSLQGGEKQKLYFWEQGLVHSSKAEPGSEPEAAQGLRPHTTGELSKCSATVPGRDKVCRSQAPDLGQEKYKGFAYLTRFMADAATDGV